MAEVNHGLAILTVLSILVLLTTSGGFAATITHDLTEKSAQDQTETKLEAADTKRNVPKKEKAKGNDVNCYEVGLPCGPDYDTDCCSDLECNIISITLNLCNFPLDFLLKNQTTTETL